jgi:hypothetical protein
MNKLKRMSGTAGQTFPWAELVEALSSLRFSSFDLIHPSAFILHP